MTVTVATSIPFPLIYGGVSTNICGIQRKGLWIENAFSLDWVGYVIDSPVGV